MSKPWNYISALVLLTLSGCGESMLMMSDDLAGGDTADTGFTRDTVDVEQVSPSEWAQCLMVSDGRLAKVGEAQRFEPGADVQLEVTLTNLCDLDIVSYPGLRFSSPSDLVVFSEPTVYLYGILGYQSLVMATQLTLETGASDGESIEFVAAVTHLGCEENAEAEADAQICEDITEGYRFNWRVGDALVTPGL